MKESLLTPSSFLFIPHPSSFIPPLVPLLQRFDQPFRVHAARAFDEYEVARSDLGGERVGRVVRRIEEACRLRAHPGLACSLDKRARVAAHTPQHFNSEARDLAPRLAVERRRLHSKLKHLARDDDPPPHILAA